MKNLILFIALFLTAFTFAQNATNENKPKLEIRTNATDNEIHRKTNDHHSERIDLKKDDRKDVSTTSSLEKHRRPNLDNKHADSQRKEVDKKEHQHDKHSEQRQETKEERFQQHKEHR